MGSDKRTIGLTPKGENILLEVMSKQVFKDKLDAAKFALSLAIRREVQPGESENAGTTWNIGSFDPEGELRTLIPILYPGTQTPYRLAESLVDLGLEIMKGHLDKNGDLLIVDLLDDTETQ